MTWSMAFPNLLVGLREGLEAGLVVTILIGAVRRLAPGRSLAGVWLGVAAAAVVSLSFGAVLTFTEAEMSPKAQEVFGGVTSLVTVALVTSMIFWMRRAARGLSGDLRERVGGALAVGGPALIFTAFVAVAREGLEAALFVWTNAQAAGSSTSPLLGAVIGLVLATGICVGLYRRVLMPAVRTAPTPTAPTPTPLRNFRRSRFIKTAVLFYRARTSSRSGIGASVSASWLVAASTLCLTLSGAAATEEPPLIAAVSAPCRTSMAWWIWVRRFSS